MSQFSEYTVFVRLFSILPKPQRSRLIDKLNIYFQKKSVSQSDVEEVKILLEDNEQSATACASGEGSWLVLAVTFSERLGVENVLAKKKHELVMDDIRISLEVKHYLPPDWRGADGSNSEDDSFESFQFLQEDQLNPEMTSAGASRPSNLKDSESTCTSDEDMYGAGCDVSPTVKVPSSASAGQYQRPITSPTGKDQSGWPHQRKTDIKYGHKKSASQKPGTTGNQERPLPKDAHQFQGPIARGNATGDNQGKNTGKKGRKKQKCGAGRASLTEDSLNPGGENQKVVSQDKQESPGHDVDDEQTLEVKGFKPSTDHEMLKMYFENKRRSGGGEVKTLVPDSKTGAIRITFKEPDVASRVCDKPKHSLENATLIVKLIMKRKECPVKQQCLLLQGIPDGCPSEHLVMFVENMSDIDFPTLEYGEMPGTALCTFPQDIEDLDKVIRKISSKEVRGSFLTVDKVHECDCILVSGLTSNTPLDMIECYFNNKRKSGGHDVREIEPGPGNNQAIVYFKDWKVVGDVLSRKDPHKLSNTKLIVEPYNHILGRLSPLDVPTPHIPKPLSVNVPTEILDYMFGRGKNAKENLIRELGKVKATLHWPDDGDKSKARLEPLVDDDGQRQSSWLKWPETVTSTLQGILDKCKVTEIPVPQPLWKDMISDVMKLDIKDVSIEPDETGHVVIVVGEQRDVDKESAAIKQVIAKLKAKADHEAEQTTEQYPLHPSQLQIYSRCGIKPTVEKSFPRLKITIAPVQNKMGLIFEGTRKDCQDAELFMRREMYKLETAEIKTGINKAKFVLLLCDKIHEILGSDGISAACNPSPDGKIVITGASKQDVTKAIAYINQEIQEDVLPVKGPAVLEVLKSQDGIKLLDGINKQKFVIANIKDINDTTGACVELAGFKTNLTKTKQDIIAFLKDRVLMKDLVPANKNKIRLITTFHGQDLTNLRDQNKKNQVQIVPQISGRGKGFFIKGNEMGLESASTLIKKLLAGIKEKQYPVSKTGMAQLFREEKGKTFLESVEKDFQCMITQDGQECDEEEAPDVGGTIQPVTEVLCMIALPNGCTLRVCKGDLTKQHVDCIVNAANTELRHVGGLALAILQAGGPIIQTECDQIIQKKGQPLNVGEPVMTSSGNLPCKKLIHVAGPVWPSWSKKEAHPKHDKKKTRREERLLCSAVLECLILAEEKNLTSIAIPAISTGVFGFPVELAAQQMLKALTEFCEMENLTLREISFTNNDDPTCNVFLRAVRDTFGQFELVELGTDVDNAVDGAVGGATAYVPHKRKLKKPDSSSSGGEFGLDDLTTLAPPPTVPILFTASGPNTLTTIEGVTVTLKKGSITNETVEVLVNTSAANMELNNGAVSIAILQAAGPALQQECTTLVGNQGKIAAGSFLVTGPAQLSCKKIYHCVCSGYDPNTAEEFLKKLVLSLLEQAETCEMRSIAIPALGTGNLKYPANVAAHAMYKAVTEFSRRYPNAVLTDIRFVVYDKDMTTIKGFEDEILSLTTGTVDGAVGGATSYVPHKRKLKKPGSSSSGTTDRESYSSIKHQRTGVMEAKIGSVCLQIAQGDIVQETHDAIVNSVGHGLDLKGPVSKAILSVGGDTIKMQCDRLRKGQKKLIHITRAGKLQCKSIFHVVTPQTPEEIHEVAAKTLQMAEGCKLRSISFPALGTGPAGVAVASCAGALLKAVGEFAVQKKPQHLHLIRLVIFQQDMMTGFQEALNKEAGISYKSSKSFVSRGIAWAKSALSSAVTGSTIDDDTENDDLQETIVLQICAMDLNSIGKATDKLDQFQREEFLCEKRTDEHDLIGKMTEEHAAEVKAIERKENVRIDLSSPDKIYLIEGRLLNVKSAGLSMQELFMRMLKEENKSQTIDQLYKEVQWKYSTPTGVETYDADINAIIEDAYSKKQNTVDIDLENEKITINLQQMKEISRAGVFTINRVDLVKAASFETPPNWIPMPKNEHFKLVPLGAGTPEYTAVEAKFQPSMAGSYTRILEIQRIQNRDLIIQYQARQTAIATRLGQANIEKELFHGTDEQTCDKINKFGFNRSFCGKNATAYGNGTYFAVNANYSAQPQYAKPNASGVKHVYVTKVLVGDYARGSHGMITPPNKPNNPDQLYDSVVDNTTQPSIYVIFHDAQAYPEYLIKFQ